MAASLQTNFVNAGVRRAVHAATPPTAKNASLRQVAPCFAPAAPSVRPPRNIGMRAVVPAEAEKFIDPSVGTPEWIALVARAEFFFNDAQNEALAEQLRELKRYYEEIGREQDFFFVSEPAWLDKFPQTKQVQRPCVALVCPDKQWMTFMKLRLDRVLKIELGPMTIDEATKSTAPVPKFSPPAKWTAPYAPYAYGWWEKFMRN